MYLLSVHAFDTVSVIDIAALEAVIIKFTLSCGAAALCYTKRQNSRLGTRGPSATAYCELIFSLN